MGGGGDDTRKTPSLSLYSSPDKASPVPMKRSRGDPKALEGGEAVMGSQAAPGRMGWVGGTLKVRGSPGCVGTWKTNGASRTVSLGRGLGGSGCLPHLHAHQLRHWLHCGPAAPEEKAVGGGLCTHGGSDFTAPERNASPFLPDHIPALRASTTAGEDSGTFFALEATVCRKKLHPARRRQETTSCKSKGQAGPRCLTNISAETVSAPVTCQEKGNVLGFLSSHEEVNKVEC